MIYHSDLAFIHNVGFSDLARSAAAFIAKELKGAGFNQGLVVDLGCGSGAFASEIVRSGYRVFGVDASPAMIEIARQAAPEADFEVSRIEDVRLPRCIAVASIGEALSYVPGPSRVNIDDIFQKVFASLDRSGRFFFDVIERGEPVMFYRAERSGDGWRVEVDVSEDANTAIIKRRITTSREIDGKTRSSTELHYVQAFSRDELMRALAEAGFAASFAHGYGEVAAGPRRLVVKAIKSSA